MIVKEALVLGLDRPIKGLGKDEGLEVIFTFVAVLFNIGKNSNTILNDAIVRKTGIGS